MEPAGALERVDRHEQLHQVVVHRRAGRLHDVDVDATHVLLDLGEDLTIGEVRDLAAPHRQLEIVRDLLGERRVRVTGEDADRLEHPDLGGTRDARAQLRSRGAGG
jgi:hypothetical protein